MKKLSIILFTYTFSFFLLSAFQCVSASSITQGEYAIQLAERLGMGENLSADAAVADLTNMQIMPARGFKPEALMNPAIADEILSAVRKACEKGLLNSLTCCKKLTPLPDKCCEEVDGLVSSFNEEVGLLPPAPPTLPPPPPRDPASVSQ
jgi:hypothetical protein